MSKNSISIIKLLRKVIYSEQIISEYKMNKQDSTRKRKQPFGQVSLFMLNLFRKSMVIEIDFFLQHLNSKLDYYTVKNFTASAFVQKRKKIRPEVFNYLSSVIIENYYVESNQNIKLFTGFRILAEDGSKITLPYTEELKLFYSESKNQFASSIVQGMSSVLYDVLNNLVLNSVLENVRKGESELALKHKEHWKHKDLIIYDRGYPFYDFKYEHIKACVDYLIRVKKSQSKIVS
jgi:hypothetical protein